MSDKNSIDAGVTGDHPLPAPISVVTLALELEEPVGSLVDRLGDLVFVDEASGLRCVHVETCRRLLAERQAWFAAAEEHRLASMVEREPVFSGAPAIDGLSPFESMIGAGDYESVNDAFGRQRPNFVADQLAAGQRQRDESRRT